MISRSHLTYFTCLFFFFHSFTLATYAYRSMLTITCHHPSDIITISNDYLQNKFIFSKMIMEEKLVTIDMEVQGVMEIAKQNVCRYLTDFHIWLVYNSLSTQWHFQAWISFGQQAGIGSFLRFHPMTSGFPVPRSFYEGLLYSPSLQIT